MENQQENKPAIIAQQITTLSRHLGDVLTECSAESRIEYKELCQNLTISGAPNFDLIFSQGSQISAIKRSEGIEWLTAVVSLVIHDFTKAFNVIRPMDADQITDLADELIINNWGYRLEDFVAFFALAKKGVYSSQVKILDRMDAGTVYSMLVIYESGRMEYLRAQQTIQIQKNSVDPFYNPGTDEQRKTVTIAGTIAEIKSGLRDLPFPPTHQNIGNE